jgi:hypothetical protein
MSATEYPTFVLRAPSSRALSMRARSAGRLETLVVAAGICLPVPLLAVTGLSVPLPNVVERIAAALVPWAEAGFEADDVATARKGTIVPSRTDLVAAAPTGSTAPVEAAEGGAPQKTARKASLLPLMPGARPASTPTRQPIATDSRPAATPSPTGSAEPERAADAPATRPTAAEPAPTAPGAQAPAPRPASDPAPAQEAPAPTPTPTTTTSTPLQETVDTVTGVVADPVGTVEETIADPIGTIEEKLPILEPVTKPLKPLLPGLGR